MGANNSERSHQLTHGAGKRPGDIGIILREMNTGEQVQVIQCQQIDLGCAYWGTFPAKVVCRWPAAKKESPVLSSRRTSDAEPVVSCFLEYREAALCRRTRNLEGPTYNVLLRKSRLVPGGSHGISPNRTQPLRS